MTVTAYASSDVLPIINPSVDPLIDLGAVVLPQVVDLYAGAVDSVNPAGPFAYVWTIVAEAEPGTPATFAGGTVPTDQHIKIQSNIWGNVRLFLVTTNTATLEASEADPLLAPDTAFVTVRVLSALEGIQKPAPGERNYFGHLYDWADAIEAAGAVGAHNIAFHSDVVTATGAKLEKLVDGSYAEDPAATDMHLHRGVAVDAAQVGTRGTVKLEDIGSGKCIQKERVTFSASPAGSLLSTGFWPGVIVPKGYDGDAGGNFSPYCAAWITHDALELHLMGLTIADGGSMAPTTEYEIELYVGTQAQYFANALVPVAAQNLPVAVDHGPSCDDVGTGAVAVPAGNVIAVACTAAPKQSEGDEPGAGLTVTVHAFRQV